jgi:hypothetical protein
MNNTYSLSFWLLSTFIVIFEILLFLKPIAQSNEFSISNIGYEVVSVCLILLSTIALTKFTSYNLYSTIIGISIPSVAILIPLIMYLFLKRKIKIDNDDSLDTYLNPLREGNELLLIYHLLYIVQTVVFLFFIHTILKINPETISLNNSKINMYILLCSIFLFVLINIGSWLLYMFHENAIEKQTDDTPK